MQGCKAAPRRIWSFHISIHNFQAFRTSNGAKIQRKPMENLKKIQKSPKLFLPPPEKSKFSPIMPLEDRGAFCSASTISFETLRHRLRQCQVFFQSLPKRYKMLKLNFNRQIMQIVIMHSQHIQRFSCHLQISTTRYPCTSASSTHQMLISSTRCKGTRNMLVPRDVRV